VIPPPDRGSSASPSGPQGDVSPRHLDPATDGTVLVLERANVCIPLLQVIFQLPDILAHGGNITGKV